MVSSIKSLNVELNLKMSYKTSKQFVILTSARTGRSPDYVQFATDLGRNNNILFKVDSDDHF